ncbi:MAG TPA: hypothetical protein VFS87_00325 [Qipengyuania sp.]|nr:hypothetical protein [Qipengyuania sp.]
MLALALGAALATQPAEPARTIAPSDFDLSPASATPSSSHAAPLVPEPPRNLDTRDFALDAPEAEWQVAPDGPVLAVGAMGGRRSGRPKLAHVALDWSF